mgnify:CR=1 FL=1
MKVGMISLGCPKNQVSAEQMLHLLREAGHEIVTDATEAEAIVVNTCAFIEDAKQEAINTILEVARHKEEGSLKLLIVTGCLAQLFKEQVLTELPEVDAVVGVGSCDEICEVLNRAEAGEKPVVIGDNSAPVSECGRLISTGPAWAYLLIADGCDNYCSYCLIPYIRGRFRSRTISDIVGEAKQLAESGVRELILVAQDVTRYGADLYNSPKLTELLRSLSEIEQVRRIRLLYCYPEEIDEALIKEIASNPKIVKYLDIPLQHVHNDILKSMNRRSSFEEICELFKFLRTEIPDISIRSTFICGFPGEQTKHFLTLKSFIEKQKLENVGFFAYSPEEGTVAALMKERISEKVTQHRLQKLAKCQQKVVRILNKRHVGKVYEVLIDDFCELDSKKNLLIYKGRTYFQTPEVDGVVYIESENELVIGEFYDVAITDFKDYDLRGEVAK